MKSQASSAKRPPRSKAPATKGKSKSTGNAASKKFSSAKKKDTRNGNAGKKKAPAPTPPKRSANTSAKNANRPAEPQIKKPESSNDNSSPDRPSSPLYSKNTGAVDTPLTRLTERDPAREPGGETEKRLPSAREISNSVASEPREIDNRKGLSDNFWLFGQFLDHDLTEVKTDRADTANISVPDNDRTFQPGGEIPFARSKRSSDNQHKNNVSHLIDGSQVYGSTQEQIQSLRQFEGGRLKTERGPNGDELLPTEVIQRPGPDGKPESVSVFRAGDERVNEHGALTSIHTAFALEHNRIADNIKQHRPDLSDEAIYQRARDINAGKLQSIVYNDFLPKLIGQENFDQLVGEYKGFQPDVDPSVSEEFATAAFRFGHTLLPNSLNRVDASGNKQEPLPLRDAFFNPDTVRESGIAPFLRGASQQTARAADPFLNDDIRNALFDEEVPSQGGTDLASRNIQRGRDHGLGSLNDVREQLGLPRHQSFDALTGGNKEISARLASVYDSVDDVDLWIGGLSERHHKDSLLGESFTRIIADQFKRSRDGDPNYYENRFWGRLKNAIENNQLSDIYRNNTDFKNVQKDAFISSKTA